MEPVPPRNPFTTRELPETPTTHDGADPLMDEPEAWARVPHQDAAEEGLTDAQMPCPCAWLDALGGAAEERRRYCYLCHGSGVAPKAAVFALYMNGSWAEAEARAIASSQPTVSRTHPAMDLQTALQPLPHEAVNDSLAGYRLYCKPIPTDPRRWCLSLHAIATTQTFAEIRLSDDLTPHGLMTFVAQHLDARLDLLAWRPAYGQAPRT